MNVLSVCPHHHATLLADYMSPLVFRERLQLSHCHHYLCATTSPVLKAKSLLTKQTRLFFQDGHFTCMINVYIIFCKLQVKSCSLTRYGNSVTCRQSIVTWSNRLQDWVNNCHRVNLVCVSVVDSSCWGQTRANWKTRCKWCTQTLQGKLICGAKKKQKMHSFKSRKILIYWL